MITSRFIGVSTVSNVVTNEVIAGSWPRFLLVIELVECQFGGARAREITNELSASALRSCVVAGVMLMHRIELRFFR